MDRYELCKKLDYYIKDETQAHDDYVHFARMVAGLLNDDHNSVTEGALDIAAQERGHAEFFRQKYAEYCEGGIQVHNDPYEKVKRELGERNERLLHRIGEDVRARRNPLPQSTLGHPQCIVGYHYNIYKNKCEPDYGVQGEPYTP